MDCCCHDGCQTKSELCDEEGGFLLDVLDIDPQVQEDKLIKFVNSLTDNVPLGSFY